MTAPTPPSPESPGRGYLAVLATVLTVALLVFVDGMLSLALDRNVVEATDAGPLVGPFMALAVCAVVFLTVFRRSPDRLGPRVVSATLWALIAGPAAGAVLYSIGRGQLGVIPVFFGTYVLSPFWIAAALIAGVVVGLAGLAERMRPAS